MVVAAPMTVCRSCSYSEPRMLVCASMASAMGGGATQPCPRLPMWLRRTQRSFALSLCDRRACRGGVEGMTLGFDEADDVVQVGHRFPIGVEAPKEAPVVAEQCDAERLVAEQRHQRIDRAQGRPEEV